jgi:hypothetical protein
MLNWSDLDPAGTRPALGGPAALEVVGALTARRRALVAGPHSLPVIETAGAAADQLDVVVRSFEDGETIAATGARVFTGGFDRFGTEHGEPVYDVIVALDGITRLASTDTPALAWADAVMRFHGRLATGGRLLLGVANAFGLPRLLDVPSQLPGDDEWGRDVGATGEPPAGLAATMAALSAEGLAVEAVYAVFPDTVAPAVALTEPDAATVAAQIALHYAGRPTLADPYRTAYDAVASGHGLALAPGYWFVLRNGTADPADLPVSLGGATRPGETVEQRLLGATRADDHQTLRRLVREYVDWLRAADPAVSAQAAADNTAADGTSYEIVEPREIAGGDPEVVAVRHLARFVTRTLAAGERWPSPAGGTPRSQTTRLAAMAGITVGDELWASAGIADEPIAPQGHAAQLATIERLSAELADARSQVDWFEGQLDRLRRSRAYRVGRVIVSPLRTAYSRIRSRLR